MRKVWLWVLMGAFAVAAGAQQGVAAVVTFDIDEVFPGKPTPGGTTPWLSATVKDIGTNQVRITMSAHSLVDEEDATKWLFNLDDALLSDPTKFSFSRPSGIDPGVVGNVDVNVGPDIQKADGQGHFDLYFDLPPPGNRLSAGELLVYDVTYSGAGSFNADSFKYLSSGGDVQYYSAVKIQSLAGGDSTWVGTTSYSDGGGGPGTVIPEPGTMVLLGTGLLGIAGVTRRRGKKGENEEEPAS